MLNNSCLAALRYAIDRIYRAVNTIKSMFTIFFSTSSCKYKLVEIIHTQIESSVAFCTCLWLTFTRSPPIQNMYNANIMYVQTLNWLTTQVF